MYLTEVVKQRNHNATTTQPQRNHNATTTQPQHNPYLQCFDVHVRGTYGNHMNRL